MANENILKETLDFLVKDSTCNLDDYVQIYTTIATETGFIYYSCPITTGSELIKKLKEKKPFNEQEIIDTNLIKAEVCVTDLRWGTQIPIIFPARITMKSWSHQDYCKFWRLVIEHFVNIAYFGDDWFYSRGCCYEYLICLNSDIPRKNNSTKKDISIEEALEKIKIAIQAYETVGADSHWHKNIFNALQNIVAK